MTVATRLSGDTIADVSRADRIVIGDGDLATLQYSLVGNDNGRPAAVLAQKFSATGGRVGDVLIVSTSVGSSTSISVAATDSGFAVAFGKAIGTDPFNSSAKQTDIAVQLFDTSGLRLGSDFIVNAASQAEQWLPSMVQFGSGDLAIAFNDHGTNSNGDVSFRLLLNPIVGHQATTR